MKKLPARKFLLTTGILAVGLAVAPLSSNLRPGGGEALAQDNTTFRNSAGVTTGTVTTDRNGARTFRDPSGVVTGTARPNGSHGMNYYDRSGSSIGSSSSSGSSSGGRR